MDGWKARSHTPSVSAVKLIRAAGELIVHCHPETSRIVPQRLKHEAWRTQAFGSQPIAAPVERLGPTSLGDGAIELAPQEGDLHQPAGRGRTSRRIGHKIKGKVEASCWPARAISRVINETQILRFYRS